MNENQIFRNQEFGAIRTNTYLVWTERGKHFIHQLLNPKFLN